MNSLICMQARQGHQLSQMVSKLPTVEWVAEELSSGLSFKYSSWSRSRAAEEEWLVTRDSWGVLELRLPRVALLHNCRCTKLNLWACKQGKVTICLNGVNTAHIWVNVSENDVRGIEMHACRCSMCAHATRHDCYQKSSCDCLSIRVHSSFLVIFYLSKVRLTPKKTGMAAMAAMAARAVQRSFELLNENALALSVCYV